jgi:hypothetical protein
MESRRCCGNRNEMVCVPLVLSGAAFVPVEAKTGELPGALVLRAAKGEIHALASQHGVVTVL